MQEVSLAVGIPVPLCLMTFDVYVAFSMVFLCLCFVSCLITEQNLDICLVSLSRTTILLLKCIQGSAVTQVQPCFADQCYALLISSVQSLYLSEWLVSVSVISLSRQAAVRLLL